MLPAVFKEIAEAWRIAPLRTSLVLGSSQHLHPQEFGVTPKQIGTLSFMRGLLQGDSPTARVPTAALLVTVCVCSTGLAVFRHPGWPQGSL